MRYTVPSLRAWKAQAEEVAARDLEQRLRRHPDSATVLERMERLMPALLAEGALELMWLTVRNEPIAALYNIAWDGRVYFYQSGRKLDLPRDIRPGVVMQIYAMQRAIEAGRREYDFLAGASQYKLQLASSTRPLMQLRAVRGSLRERVRSYAAYGVACARVWRQSARASGWFSAGEQAKPALNAR